MGKAVYTFEGLEKGVVYYVRVFPKNHKGLFQSELDGQLAEVELASFPDEPTSYNLIDIYTSTQEITAPEDGWYQIELFGRSGKGGAAVGGKSQYYLDSTLHDNGVYGVGGGGGGGGAYSCSNKIKMNKGDTISIVIGTTCTVTVTASTGESYDVMKCTTGKDGSNGTYNYGVNGNTFPALTGGAGGAGGTATGGNSANTSGKKGGTGTTKHSTSGSITTSQAKGGTGGATAYSGGCVGGTGGSVSVTSSGSASKTTPGSAQAGFCKVYRGNTNIVA